MPTKFREGPTLDRLREMLSYDPATGEFRWRTTRGPAIAGARAGWAKPNGYRFIRLDRVLYSEHRLAWLYETGK